MALTRKLLKDMQLEDGMIEEIIAAHAATVEALKAERDNARAQMAEMAHSHMEAQTVQEAFDAYRTLVEEERSAREMHDAVLSMLEKEGCNPHALELIAQTIDPAQVHWEDGMIVNAQEITAPLKEKYAAFFAKPVHLPTPVVNPPIPTGGALTREDLTHMSAEEINRNWSAVKSVLAKGAI